MKDRAFCMRCFKIHLHRAPSNITWYGVRVSKLADWLAVIVEPIEHRERDVLSDEPPKRDDAFDFFPSLHPKWSFRIGVIWSGHFRHSTECPIMSMTFVG